MRDIIRHCYAHYGLDPEEYIQEDPEDTRERGIEPADHQIRYAYFLEPSRPVPEIRYAQFTTKEGLLQLPG